MDLIPSRGGESVRGTVVAIYAQRARRGTWHLLAVTSSHPAPVRLLSEVSNSWLPHAIPDSLLLRRYDRFEDVAEVLPPDTDHALPFGHLLLASDPMDRGVAVRRPRVAGRLRRRPRRPARTRRLALLAAGAIGAALAWVGADALSGDPADAGDAWPDGGAG